jgi:uncharacterized protein YbjT (DUF2867 family)
MRSAAPTILVLHADAPGEVGATVLHEEDGDVLVSLEVRRLERNGHSKKLSAISFQPSAFRERASTVRLRGSRRFSSLPSVDVFVTGGTGYIGRPVIAELVKRGHSVAALVRAGSERRLPAGATAIPGDAVRGESFAGRVAPAKAFVQLVGVSHPSPAKASQFRSVDLASVRASAEAAARAGVEHFVYLSVAQPAPPIMREYASVRAEGEAILRATGMNATFLRPWYVLGPGHRWPYLLLPAYWLAERLPPTRDTARRIGLVTLPQMIAALVRTIETPARGIRIVEVPEIRRRDL